MPKRTIAISLESTLTDDQWEKFVSEITESVEQAACDYAAACVDDAYEVTISPS